MGMEHIDTQICTHRNVHVKTFCKSTVEEEGSPAVTKVIF